MASNEDIISALRIINTHGIGSVKFYQLLDDFSTLNDVVSFLEKHSKQKPWSVEQAKKEIAKAQSLGVKIILYSDDEYPQSLRGDRNFSPLLYVKGDASLLNCEKSIAIVGGRAASVTGRKTAAKIAMELAENNICVVSGMARGIDTSAHKGAMYGLGQTGKTIAVLGTGIDIIYPPENKEVYEQIAQQGCIISEFLIGTKAVTSNFPRRNRIVAALSEGILVVEASNNSGSLITAQYGIDMKKVIFAVPGTPGESRTQGSNNLIKNGAILVESASDILPFLKGNKIIEQPKLEQFIQKNLVFENNDDNYIEQKKSPETLQDYLTVDGVHIDELIRLTGKSASEIAMDIIELELSGIAERRAGNKIALTGDK
ncbi:MAG: DNA-processing protein DprA [Alphaproteobacteria bacterium]|nr:DNA-processing protein DprA [Alphaproteobacteria bacterium]